jgi:hypothetical protein
MLIRVCLYCKFHEIKQEEKNSYCRKEDCWSQYSKCVLMKAMDRFLNEECIGLQCHLSNLGVEKL